MKKDGAGDAFWSRPESRIWTVILLLGTCLLYCTRVAMPICAVAMSARFDWDKKQSGLVLSSFFWGYCLTQVIGGHLSDRIGGEKVLLLSASAWGSITALTPLLIYLGSAHLVLITISRFLIGLLQGVFFPALASLFSQKVRESERAFTCSTVGTGSQQPGELRIFSGDPVDLSFPGKIFSPPASGRTIAAAFAPPRKNRLELAPLAPRLPGKVPNRKRRRGK
ncbi:voltage-gated purine nucleotide uniporter SLC17A9 [Heteronotia binoei]|uniref:voltage-gated purine nucleotide uniporter SLC17A9 n=1 Tax=Heteronotia binoei TaxID=13085 RepID=UPI002930F129|nr:voltage-gated purine nucleotide uniporter SLC17A9 [Heteronotia binoei]